MAVSGAIQHLIKKITKIGGGDKSAPLAEVSKNAYNVIALISKKGQITPIVL
jgi:hypothetical protein